MRPTLFTIALVLASMCYLPQAVSNETETRHIEYPTYFTHANGITIAYQDFGDPQDEVILLIMGLGGQLIHWNDNFVMALVNSGYRVIRFDNRDIGLSEKLLDAPVPGLFTYLRFQLGLSLKAPYKLNDMAADGIALLDNLGIDQAHVVGMSMGGMIAQIMAANYPDKIKSLTSIMSTTSAPHLPAGTLQVDFRDREGLSRDEIIAESVKFGQAIDGSVAELSADSWWAIMARAYDRSHYDDGFSRQLWAILDSGDRVELLKSVTQPTLVVHGKEDTLLPYQAGEHTAELIQGARLVLLDGMGHYIDKVSASRIIAEIVALTKTS